MASQQLPSLPRKLRGRRPLGALIIGSLAGVLIAATTLPDNGTTSADAVTTTPETSTQETHADTTVTAAEPEPAVIEPAVAEPEIVEAEPFDYGDCPPDARACVDLEGERAWLQENGEVTYGAVPIGQGGPGYATPRDTFHVSRKVEFDVSLAFDNAPMPFSVYFTNQGHAFHEGDPEGDSHGCVRLPEGVAEHFYNELQVYDKVFIY